MLSIMDVLGRFGIFACQYGFSKCMKTLVCGLILMPVLFFWYGRRRGRNTVGADMGFYSWLFLLPAVLMGRNKAFFQWWSIRLTAVINGIGHTWVSGVYFAVMLLLALWWISGKLMLGRQVRKLPRWQSGEGTGAEGEDGWQNCIRQVTAGDRFRLAGRYLRRVRIYITEDRISPFCGGIFRPFIVMAAEDLEPSGEGIQGRLERDGESGEHLRLTEQGKVLLCHELLHLKSGHILWLNLFALLRIYWWVNPLIYLCEKLLQQDMEQACDEGCLYYTGVSERTYGKLLLSVASRQISGRLAGAASFIRKRDYFLLRKRIGCLRGKGEQAAYRKLHKRVGRVCAAVLAVSSLTVLLTSYPQYTRMTDLLLYDEQLHLICNNSPQLREAVKVVDGYLQIDKEGMDACLAQLEVCGSYVYLSYDTIMKVPGAGGCGNTGMIALDDYEDIFYLSADTWENRMMEFLLKYLI